MIHAARRVAFALVALVAAPAVADDGVEGPVTHTDQLIVVTPNPPVVITNGAPPAAGPSAVAPVVAPPAGMPATAAPQNEDWNNVSHINGTPVKVGERGDYLYRFRKTNISSNPIGWMFGVYGLSVSHALSNHVAIRFDGNLMNGFADEVSGYEVGISAPIYFRRTYSGPFIEPGLMARGFRDDYSYEGCYDCNTTYTSAGPQVMFGWHWMFDSGLNVAAAFGAMRNMNAETDEYGYDEGPEVEPAGYFRIGYAL